MEADVQETEAELQNRGRKNEKDIEIRIGALVGAKRKLDEACKVSLTGAGRLDYTISPAALYFLNELRESYEYFLSKPSLLACQDVSFLKDRLRTIIHGIPRFEKPVHELGSSSAPDWMSLPDEIWLAVFALLPSVSDRKSFSSACRKTRRWSRPWLLHFCRQRVLREIKRRLEDPSCLGDPTHAFGCLLEVESAEMTRGTWLVRGMPQTGDKASESPQYYVNILMEIEFPCIGEPSVVFVSPDVVDEKRHLEELRFRVPHFRNSWSLKRMGHTIAFTVVSMAPKFTSYLDAKKYGQSTTLWEVNVQHH